MPTSLKDRPQTPESLFDEQLAKEKKRAKDRLEGRDFHEEIRALERDDDSDHTATGRIITRHGRKRGAHARHESLRQAFAFGGIFEVTKCLMDDLLDLAHTATHVLAPHGPSDGGGISSKFGNQVKPHRSLQPHHEDNDYVYDAIYVSQGVFEKLMKESDAIAAKVEEMQAVSDPHTRSMLAKTIEKLAEDFEMRLHPVTQVYVHDLNRVMREEHQCTQDKALHREFRVCVFVHKSQHDELKGIKAKIGDPYNEDPREAIATGDHLKGANPAPSPSTP